MTAVVSARNDLGAPGPPVVADRLVALQARLLRLGGSPELRKRSFRAGSSDSPVLLFEGAAAALTLGADEIARNLIEALSSDDTNPLATIDGLLLAVWLAESEGSNDVAQSHLNEAMATARDHSLVEPFVRGGLTIIRMIYEMPDDHSELRTRILRRAHALGAPPRVSDLVEPLTDRELEILSYLPSRLTNTELADHFYISINTVKTHMAHIYRKLGVANRNGAISCARDFGILQTL